MYFTSTFFFYLNQREHIIPPNEEVSSAAPTMSFPKVSESREVFKEKEELLGLSTLFLISCEVLTKQAVQASEV